MGKVLGGVLLFTLCLYYGWIFLKAKSIFFVIKKKILEQHFKMLNLSLPVSSILHIFGTR